MIIAQSAATSRVYAIRHQERVDENADILGPSRAAERRRRGQRAFVVNGSPTQTAMADGAGARSQVAQLAFAGIAFLVLLFLTGPLQYLPHCVLASIVFTIAAGMVDVEGLRNILQESRGEFLLAITTAAAVVAVGVEQGILFAIGFSLVRHVRHSYQAHSMVLVPDASGRWEPAPAAPGLQTARGLIVTGTAPSLHASAETGRFAVSPRCRKLRSRPMDRASRRGSSPRRRSRSRN
jgi:MFS superfamily sulfate permease-like transporter